jgi:hypothetical protein
VIINPIKGSGFHRRPTLAERAAKWSGRTIAVFISDVWRGDIAAAKLAWAYRTRILVGLAAAGIGGLIFGMFVGVLFT